MTFRLGLGTRMVLAIAIVSSTVAVISYSLLSRVIQQSSVAAETARAGGTRLLIQAEVEDEIRRVVALARALRQNASINHVAGNVSLPSRPDQLKTLLDPLYQVLEISILQVIDQNLNPVYSAFDLGDFGHTSGMWGIAEALSGTEALVSSTGSSGIAIYAITPLSEGAKATGALVVGIVLDERFLKRISAETKSRITVLNASGRTLASYSGGNVPVKIDSSQIATSLMLKNKVHVAPARDDLTTVYFADAVLDQTLVWVVTVDSREAAAASNRQQRNSLGLALLAGLAGALILGWFSRLHAKQIAGIQRKAEDSVRQIMSNGSGAHVAIQDHSSEVDSLDASVALMTSRWASHLQELDRARAELVSTNAELEHRVRERTSKVIEGELRYRKLVEQSTDAILLCGPDQSILYANSATLEMIRCVDPEQLTGCAIETLFFAEDRAVVARSLRPLWMLPNRQEVQNIRVVAAGGDLVTVKVAAASYFSDDKLCVQVVMHDITRQRADEVLLQDQLRFIDQLLEAVPTPMSVRDERGCYLRINQAYEAVHQCTRAAARHHSVFDVLPYELACLVAEKDMLAIKGVEPEVYEHTVEVPGPSVKYMLTQVCAIRRSDGSAVGVIAIDTDVTEIRRNENDLRQANAELGVLSQQLMRAQEDERRRIARDLHDQIGQILTALKMALRSLGKRTHIRPEDLAMPIAMTDEVLGHTRSLTASLHPHILEDLGISAAVQWLVDRYIQPSGLIAKLHANVVPARSSHQFELIAFRVIQESLTNVIRHANATTVVVHLEVAHDCLHISVKDDGDGFDAGQTWFDRTRTTSLGIASMRERVAEVGGDSSIESHAGGGTEVRVILPWLFTEVTKLETH
jgi:two-component system, NarL family, sensor histidine kinase UhpB